MQAKHSPEGIYKKLHITNYPTTTTKMTSGSTLLFLFFAPFHMKYEFFYSYKSIHELSLALADSHAIPFVLCRYFNSCPAFSPF